MSVVAVATPFTREQLHATQVIDEAWIVDEPATLLDVVRALDLPEGKGFVWIAAEAQVARTLKQHFLKERGHPAQHLKAAGYWVRGDAGGSDKALD